LGPTASGKTAVSIKLAEILNAEILSMDSMLIYRGMDIGTAKPSMEERSGVPHHLIDLVNPNQEFSVAKYLAAAKEVENELANRKKNCLYVGGTGLYFKTLLFGLLEGPEIPPAIHEELAQRLAAGEEQKMLDELAEVDPISAEKLHPHDHKRILRALETWQASGRALSDWQQQWSGHRKITEPAVALEWERKQAHARVAGRFSQMIADGLLEEVKTILNGDGFGRTARQAIGYKQLLAHLEDGLELDLAMANAETATRRLIRRQSTWLGNFPGVKRLLVNSSHTAIAIAEDIAEYYADFSE